MKFVIQIICFIITTAIYIPIELALSEANISRPLVWLITGIIYLFIFYIPSNALIAMWNKRNGAETDNDSTSVGFGDKILSFLLITLLSLLGQLPLLFISVTPFFMLQLSTWLTILLMFIAYIFPVSSIIFWIWGVVCAFQSGWGVWPVVYCILFLVMFLPMYLNQLFGKRQ